MPFPTPPPDASGGILVIGYTDGRHEYSTRVHVKPFTGTLPASPYDWAYTPSSGSETGLRDTAIALIDKMKVFYDNNWNFFVKALFRVSSGVVTPVYPVPVIDAETGTATSNFASGSHTVALNDAARFIRSIYTGKTAFGGRFRFSMVGAGDRQLMGPIAVTGSSGGYDPTQDQALVTYLTGTGTNIVAHDGHSVIGTMQLTVSADPRLRRTLGFG